MKNLIFVGEIFSPTSPITTITLLDKDLSVIPPNYSTINRLDQFRYSYEIVATLDDAIVDTLYFIRVFDVIRSFSTSLYNVINTLSFSLGDEDIQPTKSWLAYDPILYIDGSENSISPISLSYTPTSTQVINDGGSNSVEWFAYSTGSIIESSSLEVGSGILYSFVMRKKSGTTITSNLVINTGHYDIEITLDELIVNTNSTGIFITEQYKMYSIFITPTQIKIWVDRTLSTTINI